MEHSSFESSDYCHPRQNNSHPRLIITAYPKATIKSHPRLINTRVNPGQYTKATQGKSNTIRDDLLLSIYLSPLTFQVNNSYYQYVATKGPRTLRRPSTHTPQILLRKLRAGRRNSILTNQSISGPYHILSLQTKLTNHDGILRRRNQ